MKKFHSILLLIICGTLIFPPYLSFAQNDDVSMGDTAEVNVTKAEQTEDSGESKSGTEDEVTMQDNATVTVIKAGENLGEEVNPLDKENLVRFVSDIKSIYKQQRYETILIIKDCREKLNSDPNQRSEIRQQCREQLDGLKDQYKEVRKSIRDAILELKNTYKISIRDATVDQLDVSGSENDEMKEKVRNAQIKIKQFKSDRG